MIKITTGYRHGHCLATMGMVVLRKKMNKILLALDGTNFPAAAFEFARQLNEHHYILLTGIFIPQNVLADMWRRVSPAGDYGIPVVEQEDTAAVKANIAKFEKLCKDNKIDYRVHKDFFDIGLTSLETESTFADFMIIGSQEFYSIFGSSEATMLVEDLLHDSRCPIVLVPEHFKTAESVVLAYDGSDESVFAIKQFIYLFPQLLTKPAFLAFISKEDAGRVPKQKEINELVKAHFSKVEIVKIVSKEKHVFTTWCMDHLNSIVVSGSYSRSGFSMLFKKSFSEEIIAHHQLPVFIAHR